MVFSGGLETLTFSFSNTASGGGSATGTVVFNGGSQGVGGVAISTLVSSGGKQSVHGVASDTTVLSGGVLNVLGGGSPAGVSIDAVLSGGGSAIISAGATASGTTVLSGATQVILGFANASGTVLNGGIEILSALSATEQLALVNSGGLELVSSGGILASATISGGTVEIGSGGQLFGAASFATSGGGTVQLDQAISFASAGAVISGFTLGDFIDFRAVGFTSGATSAIWNQLTSGANASGTLTVSSGGVSADITLLGQYVQANFKISDDTHGGTVVADPPVVAQADLLVNPHST
jgi:autotransporter passenger strand-loop-strand repeat protein